MEANQLTLKALSLYMSEKKGKLPAQLSGVISVSLSLFTILIRIVVDYSDLPDKYKNLLEADEVRREGDLLQRRVNEMSNTVQRIRAPNMQVLFSALHFSVINFFTFVLC